MESITEEPSPAAGLQPAAEMGLPHHSRHRTRRCERGVEPRSADRQRRTKVMAEIDPANALCPKHRTSIAITAAMDAKLSA